MIKLAFQEDLVPGDNLKARLAWLESQSIDGIELNGAGLTERLPGIRHILPDYSVSVTAICGGYRGWLVGEDPAEQQHFISDMRLLLEHAAELKAVGVITPTIWGTSHYLPLPKRKSSVSQDQDTLLERLHTLGEYASKLGTAILLEPLNRYQTHYINEIAEALYIIDQVSSPGVKLIADLFHMNMEEREPLESLTQAGDRLAYVHLSDSNRKLPGLGHIDFAAVFRRLREIGFDGPASVESLKPDDVQQLESCAQFLRALRDEGNE